MGRITAICISEEKGTPKSRVDTAELIEDFGIRGDAHAGRWHRQVSLLKKEDIDAFRSRGAKVEDGAFGENLVAEGMGLEAFQVGERIRSGGALLEVTQIGKECHDRCRIYEAVGECIMPKCGVFFRVLRGGVIREGDEIERCTGQESLP